MAGADDAAAKSRVKGIKTCVVMITILGCLAHFLGLHPHVATATAMQLAVFFGHALPFSSEKYFDISGSFTHFALAALSLVAEHKLRSPRQIFVAVASVVWLTRLGTFLYNRILKDGKDSRFDERKAVFVRWLGVWFFQAAWVAVVQLPVVLLNSADDQATSGVSALDGLGMALWLAGFLTEAIADSQKMFFRSKPENRHKYLTTGLWSYSRHPNYFGEILMWVAMSLICSGAALDTGDRRLFAAWLSPLFTTVLLLKVSGVPLVEAAGSKKWGKDPKYTKYMAGTSCVVPWFPAR